MRSRTLLTALATLTGLVAAAAADTPVSPTSNLPSSSPVQYTIARPADAVWWWTGATYNIMDPTKLLACRESGIVEEYQVHFDGNGDVLSASLDNRYDMGIPNCQDIVARPGGYVAVAGTNVYLLDENLQQTRHPISVPLSDMWDAHVYTTLDSAANVAGLDYAIFVATESHDIRRITDQSGGSVKVADGHTHSLGGMDLDAGAYTGGLFVTNGDRFRDMPSSGAPISGSTYVDMDNPFGGQADAFGGGYSTLAQLSRIDLHNALPVQDAQVFASPPPPAPDPVAPTSALPSNSPVACTIQRPEGANWFWTGGTYKCSDPSRMLACRNDGIVEEYEINHSGGDVVSASLVNQYNTGIAGLQDVVARPDGYVGVADNDVILLDENFSEESRITPNLSSFWDAHVYTTLDPSANVSGLDWALLVATDSDDIRRIADMMGNSVKVADGQTYSLGGMDLDEALYSNDLMVTVGEYFRNMDNVGNPIGSSVFVDMNNDQIPSGDIYGKDFFALTEWDRINIHNPLGVQDGQVYVPEPGSLALAGLAHIIHEF